MLLAQQLPHHSSRKSTPLGNIVAPHEELATLASLAQLKDLVLDFDKYVGCPPAHLLCPTTLLSLPPSITKLVLWEFAKCVPAIALPEDTANEFEKDDQWPAA